MIPDKVLQQLIRPEILQQILTTAEAKGYKEIALFKPAMESQENKLHFLVKPNKTGITLFDQTSLIRRIDELLDFEDIIVEDESDIKPEDRHKIIGKVCPLSGNSVENIAKFCFEELAIKPQINIQFENNRMIYTVEKPQTELTEEEKARYIDNAANQFKADLKNRFFQVSSNVSLKSSA